MDFPAQSLDSLPSADFDTAVSSLSGNLNLELLAQLRDNGRILDHWRQQSTTASGPHDGDVPDAITLCMALQNAVLGQRCAHQVQHDDQHLGLGVHHPVC